MKSRTFRATVACLMFAIFFTTGIYGEVKGKWFTDREKALAEAQKLKKPILAVAMDHA